MNKELLEPRHRMLITAMEYFLLQELPGKEKNNPEIMKFYQAMGAGWVGADEVPWCSAFINYIALINNIEHSRSLMARSWLKVGETIGVPRLGDIVVFWRKLRSGLYGHVGLYIAEKDYKIYTLGGNQGNEVNISPYDRQFLLGFRTLKYLTT